MAARPRFSSTAQAMRASAALRRAIIAAGGAARLAHHLGLGATSVTAWTFCPAERVEAVASASGVSRTDLRPDLFPRPGFITRELDADQAVCLNLAAGAYFARTGRCMSAGVR